MAKKKTKYSHTKMGEIIGMSRENISRMSKEEHSNHWQYQSLIKYLDTHEVEEVYDRTLLSRAIVWHDDMTSETPHIKDDRLDLRECAISFSFGEDMGVLRLFDDNCVSLTINRDMSVKPVSPNQIIVKV